MWERSRSPKILPNMLERPGQAWHKALHERERHPRYDFSPAPGEPRPESPCRRPLSGAGGGGRAPPRIDARAADLAARKEHNGRGGLEPVRYEDWEVKGLASDF